MKKLLVTLLSAACLVAFTARAADEGAKPKLSDEQKAARKALIEKYDTNKDGKLDKEEKAKMTAEDKAKWAELSGKKEGKKEEKKD